MMSDESVAGDAVAGRDTHILLIDAVAEMRDYAGFNDVQR